MESNPLVIMIINNSYAFYHYEDVMPETELPIQEGIPYQFLISMLIHKFNENKLRIT